MTVTTKNQPGSVANKLKCIKRGDVLDCLGRPFFDTENGSLAENRVCPQLIEAILINKRATNETEDGC